MSSSDEVDAEFRMSAFVAILGLRRYLRDHPHTAVEEAVVSLERSDADFAASDFDAALRLHAKFPDAIDFSDPKRSMREGLSILILGHRPWWCRFFPYGRQRLAAALTKDEFQTFRSAGLFAEQPSEEVVTWWDELASWTRSIEDDARNAQGRHAEKLSLQYERRRLASLGIDKEPRWIALEDNSAGYDIQSFELTPYGLKNLLIEVKSSRRSPPRMIVSRGEWDTAVKFGEAYIFHLWSLPSEKLTIRNVSEIASQVPFDQGQGRWTESEIPFD